jgi:hypothetical protein
MLDPLDLVLKNTDPLKDPLFLSVIVLSIILIIISAVVGTLWGRRKRAEAEARIADRRKQRRAVQDQAAQRERDMLKRYDDAKKKAEDEMKTNPRPVGTVQEITDEEVRPLPRGGGKVELLQTTGPRYMKIQGELGVSGSAPVRLSTKDAVGVQGTRTTETGDAQVAQAARVAKAKPVKPGTSKPIAVARPVAVKPGPVTPGPLPPPVKELPPKVEPVTPAPEPEVKKPEPAPEVPKPAEKPKDETPASDDDGINKLHEMLTNLDKLKK